jgi:hypothetical protein
VTQPSHEQVHQEAQKRLTEFLLTELDLTRVFLDMAPQHHDEKARQHSVDAARKGLETIRHFEEKIEDKAERASIHKRANELDRILARFQP